MILAGLIVALGVVIDDAVIDAERIMRRLEARNDGSGASIAGIVFQSTLETRSASVYAMVIVMLAVTRSSSWAAFRVRSSSHSRWPTCSRSPLRCW